MKNFIIILLLLLTTTISTLAENIHFNESIYKLKTIENEDNEISNEYYTDYETEDNWTSFVKIIYYPEISNPLKFASEFDKKISTKEDSLLLKFIQITSFFSTLYYNKIVIISTFYSFFYI